MKAEWISVSERLPEEDDVVLICVWEATDDHDGVTQRWKEVHSGTIYATPLQTIATLRDGDEYEGDEIVAWMPLPNPPEPSRVAEEGREP